MPADRHPMTAAELVEAVALAVMSPGERHYAEDMHGGDPGPGARARAKAALAAVGGHLRSLSPHELGQELKRIMTPLAEAADE